MHGGLGHIHYKPCMPYRKQRLQHTVTVCTVSKNNPLFSRSTTGRKKDKSGGNSAVRSGCIFNYCKRGNHRTCNKISSWWFKTVRWQTFIASIFLTVVCTWFCLTVVLCVVYYRSTTWWNTATVSLIKWVKPTTTFLPAPVVLMLKTN